MTFGWSDSHSFVQESCGNGWTNTWFSWQYSDQSTPMKLLFLLLNSLPSLLHYTASSSKDTPSLPSHDASTRCPYTEYYRDSINASKDCMQLIGEKKGKTEFTWASSRFWVPRIYALNPFSTVPRDICSQGPGPQVLWGPVEGAGAV